jgi:hypothetical protein
MSHLFSPAPPSLAIFTCTLLAAPPIHSELYAPAVPPAHSVSRALQQLIPRRFLAALLDRAPRCLRCAECLPWTTHPIGPKLSCVQVDHVFLAHPPSLSLDTSSTTEQLLPVGFLTRTATRGRIASHRIHLHRPVPGCRVTASRCRAPASLAVQTFLALRATAGPQHSFTNITPAIDLALL